MPCSNGTDYLCAYKRPPHLSKLSANRRSMSSVHTVSRAPSALSSLPSAVAPSARCMLNSSQLSQLLPIHFYISVSPNCWRSRRTPRCTFDLTVPTGWPSSAATSS